MPTDVPALYTNPTHLERKSAFLILAAWAFCALAGGYGIVQYGIPAWLVIPPLLLIGFAALTTEAATDVGGIGLPAALIRSRLGARSAPEWLAVYAHYWHLVIYPVWSARCVTSYRSLRARIQS